MRIFVIGNATWSGNSYGKVCKAVTTRFLQDGHEVALMPLDVRLNSLMRIGGIMYYPFHHLAYGVDVLADHVKHFKPDLVVLVNDLWPLAPDYQTLFAPIPFVPWFPVDHEPVSWKVTSVAKVADYPLVYSQFGLRQLHLAGVPKARYVPLGFEPSIYKPGDKAAARKVMGIPENAFLVSMVAANWEYPSRKAFPENLEAFARFALHHDDALLYLHTNLDPKPSELVEAINFHELLGALSNRYGFDLRKRIRFVNEYNRILGIGEDVMATIYQATDVLLAASMSEGFGMPLVEAQACGTPVIATACTSMTELITADASNASVVHPVQRFWCETGGWWSIPSVEEIVTALEDEYTSPDEDRADWGKMGVKFVKERYQWDDIYNTYWRPLLAEVAQ